jgi:hypothetical protein
MLALVIIAVLMVVAGLMMLLGFWPVTLILGGIAILVWILNR